MLIIKCWAKIEITTIGLYDKLLTTDKGRVKDRKVEVGTTEVKWTVQMSRKISHFLTSRIGPWILGQNFLDFTMFLICTYT